MRGWIIYILCCCFAIPLQSQVTALAQLDSTQIFIGDQVNLEIIINHRKGIQVMPADLSVLSKSDTIEILESTGVLDTVHSGPEMTLQQYARITSFQVGQHLIPSIRVPYRVGGQTRYARTRPIQFAVYPPPTAGMAAPELAPIKPIVREPLKLQDFLPYLIGIFILVVLISAIFYFINRGKKVEPAPEPEVWIPAHTTAIEQLKTLHAKELWQKGEVKTYQSELTHIIRAYLEKRYEVNALEMTSDEIVFHLKKKTNVSEPQQSKLKDILQIADLVKFAKANPPVDINEQFFQDAEHFVQETKTDEIPEAFLEKTNAVETSNNSNNATSIASIDPSGDVQASLLKRFIANIIDTICFSVLYVGLFLLISFGMGINSSSATVAILAYVFILSLLFLVFWFIFGFLNSGHRQSPGKKLMGIVVTNTEGEPLSMSKATMRSLIYLIEAIFWFPLLYLIFNKQKQALRDKAVGSMVINKNYIKEADLLDV